VNRVFDIDNESAVSSIDFISASTAASTFNLSSVPSREHSPDDRLANPKLSRDHRQLHTRIERGANCEGTGRRAWL